MIIISKSILNDYCAKHPETYEPILNWYQESRKSN